MRVDYRVEALCLQAEFSKWLAALDAAVLGGVVLMLSNADTDVSRTAKVFACVAMAFMLISLWGACQFLFSMPRVVAEVDTLAPDENLLDRKDRAFAFTLRQYNLVQYVPIYPATLALVPIVYEMARF
jgi:hypothetical protein